MHPIPLQVTKAYSAASIGKAYLEAMGITPLLARMPEYPKRYLGYAQSAFFGGRASAHVRKVPVPVVYTDFLSQYSTVNVLMGLWNFVTASDIRVMEDAREDLAAILREVTPEWLLDQGNWKRLAGFARVIPDGDVLPLRAKYGGNDWQIGVNYAYASSDDPDDALWYSWPDLVASVLLSGKQPRIVEAFKIEPVGKAEGLKPVEFRGQVRIDPRSQDFFKTVIEERNRLAARTDLNESERDRLKRSLKTFGSATSYGIFAQMDRKESTKTGQADLLRHRSRAVRMYRQAPRIARRVLLSAPGLAHYRRQPSAARAAGAAGHRSRRHVRDGGYRLHGDRRERTRRPRRLPGRPVSAPMTAARRSRR